MIETACPEEAELWPLAVGESAEPEIELHVSRCGQCKGRVAQLASEVLALRDVATRIPLRLPAAPREQMFNGEAANQSSEELPASIGRYRVIDRLGEAGQAVIYRAVLPGLPQEVVIKLSKKQVGRREAKERLMEEARFLANVEHPHVARVRDLDVCEDRPFLVLDYIRGVNLAQYAAGRTLQPREIATLMAKAARGVAAAHERGVLHKDLKPANIMIDEAGEPRVIDFGMAQLCDAWSSETEVSRYVAGTPQYMAPEQARGEAQELGRASDVFALGAVLYYLLAGKPPFPGDDPYEALERAAFAQFDRAILERPSVPRKLAAICLKAMSAEPKDRYRSAEEFARALERFVFWPRALRWGMAGLAASALLGYAAWASYQPSVQPPTFTFSAVQADPASFVPNAPRIKRRLVEALPIKTGDQLPITGQAPADFQVSAFLFTADGRLEQIANYGDGDGFEVDGPPGTDVLLICGRRGDALTREEIEQLFTWTPWEKLPEYSSVEFDSHGAHISATPGAAPRDPFKAPEKAVLQRADALRQALAPHVDFVQGVAFPHVE